MHWSLLVRLVFCLSSEGAECSYISFDALLVTTASKAMNYQLSFLALARLIWKWCRHDFLYRYPAELCEERTLSLTRLSRRVGFVCCLIGNTFAAWLYKKNPHPMHPALHMRVLWWQIAPECASWMDSIRWIHSDGSQIMVVAYIYIYIYSLWLGQRSHRMGSKCRRVMQLLDELRTCHIYTVLRCMSLNWCATWETRVIWPRYPISKYFRPE